MKIKLLFVIFALFMLGILPAQNISGVTVDGRTEMIRWGNKKEAVILLNDTACQYAADPVFHPGDDQWPKHRNHPMVVLGPSYYSFSTIMKGTYRFSKDTLVISFSDSPDLYYKIKKHKLILLKKISLASFAKRQDELPLMRTYWSGAPSAAKYHTAWQNRSDRIILETDSFCTFQQGRKKIRACKKFYTDKKSVTHLPHPCYYVYRSERKALYSIRRDTLTITFVVVPSDPTQNRLNRYQIGIVDLHYLPRESFSPFHHKRKKFIKTVTDE
ncbi:MAG TPA: hypothetical protein VL651_15300 [Bacteroidia bacterium]|jgi:hypothetical protein|nr:hypothetical protein [Bacteroidia bacterium]